MSDAPISLCRRAVKYSAPRGPDENTAEYPPIAGHRVGSIAHSLYWHINAYPTPALIIGSKVSGGTFHFTLNEQGGKISSSWCFAETERIGRLDTADSSKRATAVARAEQSVFAA